MCLAWLCLSAVGCLRPRERVDQDIGLPTLGAVLHAAPATDAEPDPEPVPAEEVVPEPVLDATSPPHADAHAPARKPARFRWEPTGPSRSWRYIVLHHTAEDRGSVAGINNAHLQRGWEGIGYHFVIGNGNGMPDGQVVPTFRWRRQMHGAHAGPKPRQKPYNEYGIGISLVGDFERHSPTRRQRLAARELVQWLRRRYGIDRARVIGHRDIRRTACPGRYFPFDFVAGPR